MLFVRPFGICVSDLLFFFNDFSTSRHELCTAGNCCVRGMCFDGVGFGEGLEFGVDCRCLAIEGLHGIELSSRRLQTYVSQADYDTKATLNPST